MSEESKNFTVKLDNEKLKKALEVLENAIKLGNHLTYAAGIEYRCRDRAIRVTSAMEGESIDVPIEYIPVLARNLLRAYFDVIEQYVEITKRLETGVWK
jgi:hypothetical protein